MSLFLTHLSKLLWRKKYTPIIKRAHSAGEGIQKIYRFPNNYGASVVRFKLGMFSFLRNPYGSYTNNEKEWELAVIHFLSEDNLDFELTYDTEITDDVIGHLTDSGVDKILSEIEKLPLKKLK